MQFVVAECGKLWRHHRVGLLSILIRIQSLQMRVEASLMMKLFALCDEEKLLGLGLTLSHARRIKHTEVKKGKKNKESKRKLDSAVYRK
ncbi:hypothetical protein GmHk_09G026183 [Glycine max]|nr:hypothetical protein GmHk_09G026183 [Glycine max]